jgi:hypothetical protein
MFFSVGEGGGELPIHSNLGKVKKEIFVCRHTFLVSAIKSCVFSSSMMVFVRVRIGIRGMAESERAGETRKRRFVISFYRVD